MTAGRIAGVIDIGKTNAKVALVDLGNRTEIAMRKAANVVQQDGPYPHYAVDTLWEFICDGLAELSGEAKIDALSVTTHGAAAALIDAQGELTMPVLDYEFTGPDDLKADYDAIRPAFEESFTPRLPAGLNLGAQLYWQAQRFPDAFARTRWIVTYPQYWSYRLSGVVAAEITSLGCHTDLWNFETDLYSSLVFREGWLDRMPEVRKANDVLGLVRPNIGDRLKLPHPAPVYCGIHDSNASLLPHLIDHRPPFSVVSSGTWVIVAAPGADLSGLDPARDCLANIDAFGRPVASARFMGGREYALIVGDAPVKPGEAAITRVLNQPVMLLPSVVEGSGPYPDRKAKWTVSREALDRESVAAAAAFYLALMTAECLTLSGADGDISVEGPLAANPLYLEMLAAATARPVFAMRASATGTAIGAALLTDLDDAGAAPKGIAVAPRAVTAMVHYAERWREAVRQG